MPPFSAAHSGSVGGAPPYAFHGGLPHGAASAPAVDANSSHNSGTTSPSASYAAAHSSQVPSFGAAESNGGVAMVGHVSKGDPYGSLLGASSAVRGPPAFGEASSASFCSGSPSTPSDILQRLHSLSGSAPVGVSVPSSVTEQQGLLAVPIVPSASSSPIPSPAVERLSKQPQRFASAPVETQGSAAHSRFAGAANGAQLSQEAEVEESLKQRLLRLSGSCGKEDEDSDCESEGERSALQDIQERLQRLAGIDAQADGEEEEEEDEPEAPELREMRLRLLRLKSPPPGHEVEDQEVNESYEDDVDSPADERDDDELPLSDEGEGADTPEQCGMIVRWQEQGKELVPTDPTKNLSPAQAQRFLEQKELVPTDYNVIADDPRFKRLKNKWDPNIFTKKGAKQYVKNKLHPETLPYIGLMFHAHHACDSVNAMDRLKKIEKTAGNDDLRSTFKTMKGAQRTRAMQETAYTGVGAAMLLLPLFDVVPGLGPNLMIVGQVVTEVAEKGISLGLRVLVTEGAKGVGQATTKPQKSFGTYGQTKAFLMYLGAPYNPDPLYAQWEDARMRLKALYGCRPEDDLFKMKPKGRLLEQLRREEEDSKMAYVAEVPLLLLLFRTFHCWDELLYDRLMQKKDSAINLSRSILLNSAQDRLALEDRRRKRDLKKLQDKAALVETQQGAPIDPHLRLLNSTFKRDVVHVLCEAFLHSNRVAFLFNDRKPRSFQRSNIKRFMRMIVDYFYEHNAYVWGYVAEDHRILGVAIWDRPNRTAKISLLSMLSLSSLKLGPTRFRQMTDLINDMEEVRNDDIRGVACWMIHWLGVLPIANRQGIGRLLVENCLERHPEPLYVQLLNPEKEALEFFTQCRFEELRRSPTRAFLRGSPVEVVSMWLGVESPDAIRQLPVKSKGRLALTYAVLRKAASNPSLLLAGSLGSSRAASKAIPLALQTAEYIEAKKELEYAEQRLQELRVELAQDDDLYSGLDEVVKEQEAVVEQLRERFEAVTKALAKERKTRGSTITASRSRTNSFSKLGRSRKKLAASAPAPALGYGVSSPALLQNGSGAAAVPSFPSCPLPVPSRALPVPPVATGAPLERLQPTRPAGEPPGDNEEPHGANYQLMAVEAAAAAKQLAPPRPVPGPPPALSAFVGDESTVGFTRTGHRPLPPPPSSPDSTSTHTEDPEEVQPRDSGAAGDVGSVRQPCVPPPTLSALAAMRQAAAGGSGTTSGTEETAPRPNAGDRKSVV